MIDALGRVVRSAISLWEFCYWTAPVLVVAPFILLALNPSEWRSAVILFAVGWAGMLYAALPVVLVLAPVLML